jgi:tartrate/fumarate subfamily iron-sulfur-dependent hydro-lyase alpha chain
MVQASVVAEVAGELYQRAVTGIPDDVLSRLRASFERETNERARKILESLLKSAAAASQSGIAVCQDTGLPVFFIKCGLGIEIEGNLGEALAHGVAELTLSIPYRAMAVHPITRDRPLTGTGKGVPIVHFDVEPELDCLEITAAPKGAGCGVWCAGKIMLYRPDKHVDDIKKFVVDSIVMTGGQACPPYIVGVGLGGTFEEVALLAARATLRPLNETNPEPAMAALEEELLGAINSIGMGPMGLGGETTALGVNIEYAYTNVPWNPVAVNIQCWPCRRATARIYADGDVIFGSGDTTP